MTLHQVLTAFFAGALSVLVFHQGVWAVFAAAGKTPAPAWDFRRVPPLGIPQVVSSAFWGGVWGIALAAILPWAVRSLGYWTATIGLGALLTTVVALLVVFPMKGRPFAAGWNPAVWIFALLVNGAWGFGFGLLWPLLMRT
jgi:hypothetical protein